MANKNIVIDNSYSMERSKMYKKVDNTMKRSIDIIGSLCGIVLLCPIFILVAVLIKAESPGPIIFKQTRIGKDSKPFNIYKFRSMKLNAPIIATRDFENLDIYVTRIGKLIRKTSIDELPQLLNILKGDMSLVGPRPVIDKETELLELRRSHGVDQVLPGITGLAQINGRDSINIETKVKYDYEYATQRNLKLDIYIIVKTLLEVVRASDIKE